jgi:hypothetical protein
MRKTEWKQISPVSCFHRACASLMPGAGASGISVGTSGPGSSKWATATAGTGRGATSGSEMSTAVEPHCGGGAVAAEGAGGARATLTSRRAPSQGQLGFECKCQECSRCWRGPGQSLNSLASPLSPPPSPLFRLHSFCLCSANRHHESVALSPAYLL